MVDKTERLDQLAEEFGLCSIGSGKWHDRSDNIIVIRGASFGL